MENKDTNTDYLKVIKVGDQKWEIVETTIGIFFLFFFVWDSHSLFFIQEVFKFQLKKIILTYTANSHPKFQFDLGPSYINLQSPPHHPGRGCGGWELNFKIYYVVPLCGVIIAQHPVQKTNISLCIFQFISQELYDINQYNIVVSTTDSLNIGNIFPKKIESLTKKIASFLFLKL